MDITKQNGDVAFSEADHIYWNVNTDQRYISVTTLIGKYEQPFDSDFWSSYKAFQSLVDADSFKIEKPTLLKTKKWDDSILDIHNIDSELFENTKQSILDEWARKNKEACERGTKIHSAMENKFYKEAKNCSLKSYGIGGKFQCIKGYNKLDLENGVYPEYLVYYDNDNLHLAGQIDLLIKQGNNIIVGDFKTNSSIDKKSGYDAASKKNAMMRYPLNNLMDCNFSHYSLQLSTYAYMIKKNNPDFNIERLFILHFPHEGGSVIYEVDYLENEVERMLTQYKKDLVKEAREAKRKRIEF